MANIKQNVKIQLRRDSKENWNDVNPILRNGELVIVQDKDDEDNTIVSFKMGDGINPYKNLPFIPLLEAINSGYIYFGKPVQINGKITLAIDDVKEDNSNKSKILSKKQIFDLKFKYLDMIPEDGSGKKIENWWENSIAWINVSMNKKISLEFAREFKNNLVWETLCYYNTLSEEIMREFSDKINWKTISSKQMLSEGFIREFKDKLDWNCIPYYQKLSEEFIEEMKKEDYIK